MEGVKIYEDSYQELLSLDKQVSSDTIVINLNKLDGVTKEMIVSSLQSIISERSKDIFATIQNGNLI